MVQQGYDRVKEEAPWWYVYINLTSEQPLPIFKEIPAEVRGLNISALLKLRLLCLTLCHYTHTQTHSPPPVHTSLRASRRRVWKGKMSQHTRSNQNRKRVAESTTPSLRTPSWYSMTNIWTESRNSQLHDALALRAMLLKQCEKRTETLRPSPIKGRMEVNT